MRRWKPFYRSARLEMAGNEGLQWRRRAGFYMKPDLKRLGRTRVVCQLEDMMRILYLNTIGNMVVSHT